jgi:protein-disulfide isomerase
MSKKENSVNIWQVLTIAFAVLFVASTLTGGFSTGTAANNQGNQQPGTLSAPLEVGADATGDPFIGGSDATVEIVEFSDFQCPFCARTVPTVKQILDEYGNQVKIVYKDFPLSFHQNAQKAAEVAECADDQGSFWEYHDVLFANQASLDTTSLKKYAQDLGLDTGQFNECLDSGKHTQEVLEDFNEGRSLGISGTPTFFINGRKLVGAQPFSAFKAIIDQEL